MDTPAQTGIKETLELLQGLGDLAVDAKKLEANGKDYMADIAVAKDLFTQLPELTAAIGGISSVPAEVKELDSSELEQIGAKVLEIVARVRAA